MLAVFITGSLAACSGKPGSSQDEGTSMSNKFTFNREDGLDNPGETLAETTDIISDSNTAITGSSSAKTSAATKEGSTASQKTSSGDSQVIKASKANTTFFGRHYEDTRFGAWFFNWTNGGFVVSFTGTSFEAEFFSNIGMNDDKTKPVIKVYIDQQEPAKMKITQNGWYTLAKGLKSGQHTIKVVKLNESMLNSLSVKNYRLSPGGMLKTPPSLPARRIEIIGDSITCGYGNVPPYDEPQLTSDIEDGTLTYGAFIQEHFNADVRIVAISGAAVYRNYLGTVSNFFTRYSWSDYYDETPYDFSEWIPQLVVINLGTNDFDKGSTYEEFITGGKKWIDFIRSKYPNVTILWTYGVMNRQSDQRIRDVIKYYQDKGDKKIFYQPLELMDTAADGTGGGGHPTAATHRKMADTLIPRIKEIMKW